MERFPENLIIAALDPEVDQPVKNSDSKGGKVHVKKGLKHRMVTEVELVEGSTMSELDQAQFFLSRHVGHRFEIVLPFLSDPRSAVSPTIATLVSPLNKGASTVTLSGFPASTLNAVHPNDPLLIAGDNKVYRMSGGDSDGAGRVTVNVFPAIKTSISAGSVATLRRVPFTVRMEGIPSAPLTGPLNSLSFEIKEDA